MMTEPTHATTTMMVLSKTSPNVECAQPSDVQVVFLTASVTQVGTPMSVDLLIRAEYREEKPGSSPDPGRISAELETVERTGGRPP